MGKGVMWIKGDENHAEVIDDNERHNFLFDYWKNSYLNILPVDAPTFLAGYFHQTGHNCLVVMKIAYIGFPKRPECNSLTRADFGGDYSWNILNGTVDFRRERLDVQYGTMWDLSLQVPDSIKKRFPEETASAR